MPVYKSKNKTKDNRQYYYSVSYVENGKQLRYNSKKYATKKEAEKAEALYILNHLSTKANKSDLTFDQLASACLEEKKQVLKPQSYIKLEQCFKHVCEKLGSMQVEKLDVSAYEDFRKWIIAHDWSIRYKNRINNHLKTLLNFAYVKYDINNRVPYKYKNIVDPTAQIQEMQILTFDEFKQFIAVIPESEFIYKQLFIALFFTCCRIGELNALTFDDISFENSTISINKTVTTKMSGKDSKYLILSPKTKSSIRTIPIPKIVLEGFKTMLDYYSKRELFTKKWYVFGGLNPLPETTITKYKNKYCDRSNNKRIRLHDFRHSGASYYAHLNCPVTALSKLLGHSSTYQTLSTYSHYYITDLDQLMTKIEDICI